jgi:NAD+ synthase
MKVGCKGENMDRDQRIRALVDWIQDKVMSAGCRGVVFGLSGGVDSSLLAALCQRAFPKNVLALIMPCYSLDKDKQDAELVARQFDVPTKTVGLKSAYDTMLFVMPDSRAEPSRVRVAQANLKARLRMATLYYVANQMNYMVAGASNRSEITMGYFTKYGDGGVDILPLGNLVKKEVMELARHLGIPRDIVDKTPTAGLWEGQTDEDELGMTYEALDRYILTGSATEELKSRIEFQRATSHHKSLVPPVPDF